MGFQIIAAAESLIEDRQREAERLVLVARLRRGARVLGRPGPARHAAALGLAAVSRMSAGAVRRLDRCLADDLGRQLAATDRA